MKGTTPIPKRPFSLPRLFACLALASLAGLFFIFSGHRHVCARFQNLPVQYPHRNPNNFKLLIKVLAYNRLIPLKRCLNSLARADYGSDRVDIHINVDYFKIPEPKNLSYINEILESRKEIIDFLHGFRWPYGEKVINSRHGNVGLQSQWIEAWLPGSDDEFGFIVEDDLEISPFFYKFFKAVIMKYYYDKSNYNPSIFGVTLQRPRFVSGKHGNKIDLHLDKEEHFLLYQMVGTWGQLLFPKPWKEFRDWYDDHKSKGIEPILQGMVSTGWYKKSGNKIWTPWFIKFIHSKGYFNIYTNFGKERALSVSHRDKGANYGKSAGPDSNLITKMPSDINIFKITGLSNMKWYDFCFKDVLVGRFVKRLDEVENVIKTVEKDKNVILVSLYGVEKQVVRNLICHFEKVGLKNYVFLGDDFEFLSDLARRGHAVMDGNQLFNGDIIYVKGILVKKLLDFGYNIWLMDGNMVPLKGISENPSDNSYDFFVRKDLELMFVRNSLISKKIWTDKFVSKIQNTRKPKSIENEKFVFFVMENLRQNGVKIGRLEEWILPVDLGSYSRKSMNEGNGESVVYWSGDLGSSPVASELERVGLWLLDEDSSCNAVVCQPQLKPNKLMY